MEFALTDFFVIGLGCDVVGAWLLARGLIATEGSIVLRTTGFYGSNHAESFSAAEDRVDAWFGVGVLIVGYFLQAVGYVLELAADNDVRNSGARAVTAALLLVVTILAAWLAWRWTRSRRLRKVLIEMAHWRAPNVRQPPDRDPLPNAERLAAWAEYMGKARDDAEDDRSYVKRVSESLTWLRSERRARLEFGQPRLARRCS